MGIFIGAPEPPLPLGKDPRDQQLNAGQFKYNINK